ncbi:MAG: hypothetical protein EAZ91_22755 [Cytophagales bacterium]|nr:MAG: hypothetical protein EAZ91_22755 [Cytophagales bacterium]
MQTLFNFIKTLLGVALLYGAIWFVEYKCTIWDIACNVANWSAVSRLVLLLGIGLAVFTMFVLRRPAESSNPTVNP